MSCRSALDTKSITKDGGKELRKEGGGGGLAVISSPFIYLSDILDIIDSLMGDVLPHKIILNIKEIHKKNLNYSISERILV